MAEPPVRVERRGVLGRLTLDRPAVLNSLDLDMVRILAGALDAWADDAGVQVVALDGAGDRGLCAGGDMRAVRAAVLAGDPMPRRFFREEYALDARIARSPQPVVVLMDGIVMGGGVGLAGHASHRLVTARSRVAMPEVGIGFAPDVGGSYLLSRAPGELGVHCALTAADLGPDDAIAVGLADAEIDPAAWPDLLDALAAGADADEVVGRWARPGETSALAARRWIDPLYAFDTVPEIVAALDASSEPEARAAAATIRAKSPIALAVTLRSIRTGATLPSLEACLDQEYRISCAFLDCPDFLEGVRAQLVDKDRTPRWDPATIEAITPADVDRFFAARDDELGLA